MVAAFPPTRNVVPFPKTSARGSYALVLLSQKPAASWTVMAFAAVVLSASVPLSSPKYPLSTSTERKPVTPRATRRKVAFPVCATVRGQWLKSTKP